MLVTAWINFNAQMAIASGEIRFEHKLTSASNCSYYFPSGEENLPSTVATR